MKFIGSVAPLSFPVLAPGDAGFDAAAGHDLIAYPADAREVTELFAFAQERGLRIGTDIEVRLAAMTELRVDPERRTARVGAGVLVSDVVAAAAPHGLATLHTSSPDTTMAAAALGARLGWMSRLFGSSSVTAVEFVRPDGEHVRAAGDRVDAGSIVTAIELELFPVATVYAGVMVWDAARAAEVVPAWIDWAVGAPDAVTSVLKVVTLPDGRRVVMVAGAVVGEEPEANEFVRPLAELGPELDTFAQIATADLMRLHDDCGTPGTTTLVRDLDADAFVAAALATDARCELRQLGGALAHLDGDLQIAG